MAFDALSKPMPKRVLFQPEEYREITEAERCQLAEGYEQAINVVRGNITPRGFSACSLEHNQSYGTDINYRSVWARDGALTTIWTLDLDDSDIRAAQANTLSTLLDHQSPAGQIPANVRLSSDKPEYAGVGGIASIDSVLWIIIACQNHADATGDWSIIDKYVGQLQRAMDWLTAHDSNNCGLLEIPEASDWADLFGYSFHVLYDEVLWQRCLNCYGRILQHLGEVDKASAYIQQAQFVRHRILRVFWPTTRIDGNESNVETSFTDTQYSLGDARYLVAQVSPFSFRARNMGLPRRCMSTGMDLSTGRSLTTLSNMALSLMRVLLIIMMISP